jgi:type II secretion system protein L
MNRHVLINKEPFAAHKHCAVLWVPGEKVVAHRVPRPKAPKRKWPDMLPWLLEDRLLQPVESLHFVAFDEGNTGEIVVYTVSQSDMKDWLGIAAEQGLRNFRMLPDYLALPWQPGSISIAARDELLLVRTSLAQGFAAPAAIAGELLSTFADESVKDLNLAHALARELLPASLQARARAGDWQTNWQDTTVQPGLADINLLVHTFSQKPQRDLRAVAGRALAPMFGLLLVVLGMAYLGYSNRQLEQELAQLQAQQKAEFTRQFPALRFDAEAVRDDVESLLSSLYAQQDRMSTQFMGLLANLDTYLATCGCTVQGLGLGPEGGEVLLAMDAGQSTAPALQLPGFKVDAGPAADDGLIRMLLAAEGAQP